MPLLNARYRPGCCDQACAYSTDVVVFAQPANAIHFRVRVGGCARIPSCSRVSGWPLTPMRPAELFRVCPMGIQWEQNSASSKEVSGSFRSEEHTSELQSLMRITYSVFCLKKKKKI